MMIKDIHAATSETDQEEVAKTVAQYNYLALPVVNRQNKFLGIVTIDDVVDIIREEASEDFLQMAGVGKDREILLKSPIENAQSRAPWIFASLIGGVCAAAIIGYFDYLIKEMLSLGFIYSSNYWDWREYWHTIIYYYCPWISHWKG